MIESLDVNSSKLFTVIIVQEVTISRYINSHVVNIQRNLFSQRMVNDWNWLPSYVMEATSVNSFKNIDRTQMKSYTVD